VTIEKKVVKVGIFCSLGQTHIITWRKEGEERKTKELNKKDSWRVSKEGGSDLSRTGEFSKLKNKIEQEREKTEPRKRFDV